MSLHCDRAAVSLGQNFISSTFWRMKKLLWLTNPSAWACFVSGPRTQSWLSFNPDSGHPKSCSIVTKPFSIRRWDYLHGISAVHLASMPLPGESLARSNSITSALNLHLITLKYFKWLFNVGILIMVWSPCLKYNFTIKHSLCTSKYQFNSLVIGCW